MVLKRYKKPHRNIERMRPLAQTLPVSPHKRFEHILSTAYWLHKDKNRQAALDYLRYHRPWLKQYLGGQNTPASGTLLDAIINQRDNH